MKEACQKDTKGLMQVGLKQHSLKPTYLKVA